MEIDNQQLLHRNTYVSEEQVMLIPQIAEEQEMPIYDITMENEIAIPVEDQHIESLDTIEGRKRKAKGKEHFEFYIDRSSNTRYSLVCTDEKCGWTVRGSRIKESTLFKIVKFQRTHECSVDIRKSHQRQTTSNVIRDYMIDNLRDITTEVKPKFVISEMKRAHEIDVGYGKALHAIQKELSLLRGTTKQNYEQLPSYLYMIEQKIQDHILIFREMQKTGIWTSVEEFMAKILRPVTAEYKKPVRPRLILCGPHRASDGSIFGRFVYMFFMYGESISGWKYCRPLTSVDGTFLKNKYKGILLVAFTKDANNQIFPIAFGVADSENNESYEWYFRELRKAIGIRKNLMFLSDRHKAIAKVFLEFYHATIDKKTFHYLMEEPPGKWARSHCPRRRYDMLTTNIVESMNNVLRGARELPLLTMMDFIQEKRQSWFYERRTTAKGIFREISNWAEATLKEKIKPAFTFRVLPINRLKFNVKEGGLEFIVDLDKRTCDCSEFQLDEIPCEHAIAAIDSIYQKKSSFCSAYYSRDFWLKTYEGQVNSVGDSTTWVIPDTIKSEIIKPLDAKVMLGRK
uniref:Uncharacterized protein LOC104248815 n=1 Tax=Nicotiana sylvestris TaxID=4096 RepID=A0A1U7YN76_NICSY|nr:PREDICTED: uncharacterized protein LOC104248815 [Nicotiana sylvestris]